MDRTVVHQPGVGQPGQTIESLAVVVDDRLVGDIARSAHEHSGGESVEEEMLQRGARQHHPHLGCARCHVLDPAGGTVTAASEHDRALW